MPYYDIMISQVGIMLTTKVTSVANVMYYVFSEDKMKQDLFLKLLGISLRLENGMSFAFKDFVIEDGTKEILDFFARIGLNGLIEEEKLKTLVKQYLYEDMSREQFEQEIIPYRVAEKLSE